MGAPLTRRQWWSDAAVQPYAYDLRRLPLVWIIAQRLTEPYQVQYTLAQNQLRIRFGAWLDY